MQDERESGSTNNRQSLAEIVVPVVRAVEGRHGRRIHPKEVQWRERQPTEVKRVNAE